MNPPIKISADELEKLARIGATQPEIAAWFDCSLAAVEKNLKRNPKFRAALEKGNATFNISLRRKQAQLADEGNVTMLIWLGKNRLGQRDQLDQVLSGMEGSPVTLKIIGVPPPEPLKLNDDDA